MSQLLGMRNWRETADKVVSAGKRVQHSAVSAKQNLATDRHQIVRCRTECVAFLALIAELVGEGATSALLGPGIAQTYLVDWEALEPEYNAFRDTRVPALRDAIDAHSADLLRGTFTATGFALDYPLPGDVTTAVTGALDAVIDSFPAAP